MVATGADALQVTWLGHSTVVLETAGRKLVADPLLGRHSGVLRRRGARPSEVWRDPDAVLLSHLHHDHAEVRSLRLLGDVPILTGRRNAGWLHRRGLRGVGLDDGWFDVDADVAVRLVHAIHHARPMPHRPNDVHGHLVLSPSYTIWVAGDTSLYDEMTGLAALGRRERIDLAV